MNAILAIEVSTPTGSVAAISPDGTILFQASFTSGRSHNSSLFAPLSEALASLEKPDAILVGTGPGSYTGVRVGIAAAEGIGLARGIPVAGAPSVLALTPRENSEQAIIAIGDARRGNGWWMQVDPLTGEHSAPEITPASEFPSALDQFPAASIYCGEAGAVAKLGVEGISEEQPEASHLARWGAALPSLAFSKLLDKPALPVYVEAPFVSRPKKSGK